MFHATKSKNIIKLIKIKLYEFDWIIRNNSVQGGSMETVELKTVGQKKRCPRKRNIYITKSYPDFDRALRRWIGRFRCGFQGNFYKAPPPLLFNCPFPHFLFVSVVNIFDEWTKHVSIASSARPPPNPTRVSLNYYYIFSQNVRARVQTPAVEGNVRKATNFFDISWNQKNKNNHKHILYININILGKKSRPTLTEAQTFHPRFSVLLCGHIATVVGQVGPPVGYIGLQ